MEDLRTQVFAERTTTSQIWQCDNIRIGYASTTFEGNTFFAARNEDDHVRLHFGLKGDYRFHHRQLGRSFDLIGGHHNIMFSRGIEIEVHNHSPEIETFGIQFPSQLFINFTQNANDRLKRFSEKILDGKSVIFSDSWGSLNLRMEEVIREITHSGYKGDLQRLFLLSKSIELLVLSAESCLLSEERDSSGESIKKGDKEKIIAARDIINDRYQQPPSLSELAAEIGLNEYKLKRGFREIFQTTVFGYLSEKRLMLAQAYLRDTDKTAAEIAYELGYSTPQHFNNAFKKRFGLTPKSVRKNP